MDPGVDKDWVRAMATRLREAIRRPLPIGDHSVTVGTSIGIVRFPGDGDRAEDLLNLADAAMYRAKQGRESGIDFHGEAAPAG
jgi:GGDEF domain-containing protein